MKVTLKVKNDIVLFDKQAKAGFFELYKPVAKKILTKFGGIMRTLPSDGPDEKYPSLGATPQIQDYDEGNVPVSTMSGETQSIENKLAGMGLAIPLTFFEDIDRMKGARSLYLERIAGLSTRAANYKVKLLADILLREGRYTNAVCWDGNPLFSTSHTNASNIIDTGTSTSYTQAQLKLEHAALLVAAANMKDPDGEDLLREEAPDQWLFIVDPQYLPDYAQFYRAINNVSMDAVAAAVTNALAPGNKGIFTGVDGLGNQVTLVGWSRMAGKEQTLAFDVSGMIPGPPPVIDQERIAPEMTHVGVGSDLIAFAEELFWKVRMRGNMGFGDFNKAFQIDKS